MFIFPEGSAHALPRLCPNIISLAEIISGLPLSIDARFDLLYAEVEAQLIHCTPLHLSHQDCVLKGAGIYAIYYCGELVYIGSTDELKTRLRDHRTSVMNATRIDIADVTYRCTAVGRHAAKSVEGRLIEHYSPPWNYSGFGSKANGNGRRHQRQSVWDSTYGRAAKR